MKPIELKTAERIVALHSMIKAERAIVAELKATTGVRVFATFQTTAGYAQETTRLNAAKSHPLAGRIIRDLIAQHHDRIGAHVRELHQLGGAIPD